MEAFTYYNLIAALLLLVWVLFFLKKQDVRKEMLTIGVLSLFLLPISVGLKQFGTNEVITTLPLFTLADAIFTFSIAGIAASIYHVLLGKHYEKALGKKKKLSKNEKASAQLWFMRIFIAFLAYVWMAILLGFIFDLRMPVALFLSALVLSVYLVSHRHDLLKDSLLSGFLTAFAVFTAATVAQLFFEPTESGAIISSSTFLGVHTDLLLWSLALGLAIGPLYEFIRRFELK